MEHGEGFFEVGFEVGFHGVEDLGEEGIAERIEDLVSFFAGEDEVFCAEDGEVLGGVGLFDTDLFDESADGGFSVAEAFDDVNPGGVGEDLEDVGFEFSEGFLEFLVGEEVGVFGHGNSIFEIAKVLGWGCFVGEVFRGGGRGETRTLTLLGAGT